MEPTVSTAQTHPVQPHPVQSSLIASIAYHPNPGLLDLVLTNGYRYRYFGVPGPIYTGLLQADSKGCFFNARIKGVFPYQRC
jgi:hypothetical protein